MNDTEGRSRAVIEGITPQIDGGRFPIKRTVGERVIVEADVFADGHDVVDCVLQYRSSPSEKWRETALLPLGNDRWRGEFALTEMGTVHYTVTAWVDRFLSWRRDLARRLPTDSDITVHLSVGAELIEEAIPRASRDNAVSLKEQLGRMMSDAPILERLAVALDAGLAELMKPLATRRYATRYERELAITVDRVRARYSTWYELFPRSWSPEPGKHGTLRDVIAQLPRIATMGFDVLYLPPIHPIGQQFRKGKNNSPQSQPGDVGSPWGIGAAEGGHTAIHPQLGTLDDFQALQERAKLHGIELALDIAYQCSPDHPWVKEHPEWFRQRPDGSIQYAENPPKKYQDIYPIDFESTDWEALWEALAGVVEYWVGQGVRIFRVDNPHTKAYPFWEWMIQRVQAKNPETIFLAEAFTRPKVMARLAKVGFTQSYTYFTWRNTKAELTEYFTQLTKTELKDYFRPNLWPNTPDILPEYLQWSGRSGFMTRLILAATLGASYGIYGPTCELCVSQPMAPGKEEYIDSEKYQITQWKLGGPNDLSEFITQLNRIRHENSALHSDHSLVFHETDNPEIICYSKHDATSDNRIVSVVNLDPHHAQSGWVNLNLKALQLDAERAYQMQDLLAGGHYLWHGARNFVRLDPHVVPAHVYLVRQQVRTEHDFDYFL